MLDSLCKIENISEFLEQIKKEALETFLVSYKHSSDFIKKYNKNLISNNDVMYELKGYIINKNNEWFIESCHIDNVIKEVYKYLVYKIMSKLVDEGVLELCWDNEAMNFIWRKKKYARIKKWKKVI